MEAVREDNAKLRVQFPLYLTAIPAIVRGLN